MDTQNFEFAFLNLPVLCITFSACILCSFFAKHFKQCKCKINCYLFIYHNQRQVDLSAFEFGNKNRALFGTFTFFPQMPLIDVYVDIETYRCWP